MSDLLQSEQPGAEYELLLEKHTRAMEDLQRSEERFRALSEQLPVGVYLADLEGRCLHVNARWCEMAQRSEEEVLGGDWAQVVHPDDRDAVFRTWLEAARSGGQWELEYRFLTPEGGITWVYGTASAQRDADGRITGYVGVNHDITARKLAERALRDSETKYRLLFASSRDAIMTLAPPSWLFTSGNPACLKMFRAGDEATFTSCAPWEFSPKMQPDGVPSSEKAVAMINQAMQEGHHFFNWRHKRLDGEEFPATVLLTRMNVNGEAFLQATVRDETERKALEACARQSQRLDSIGMLAGGVAHEINNPLNGIMNYAQLIVDRADGAEQTVENYAREIVSESKRIAGMTQNLIQFSRQGARTHNTVLIEEVIEDAIRLVRSAAWHDNIDIDIDISEDLPRVECHSQQIQQVIVNLVANARDSLNERSKVREDSKRIRIEAGLLEEGRSRWLRLTVEDNGKGIREQDTERLFDPFYTTKPFTEGTGLGLSISHGIVRDHNGRLLVESEPQVFTRFHVDLPVA